MSTTDLAKRRAERAAIAARNLDARRAAVAARKASKRHSKTSEARSSASMRKSCPALFARPAFVGLPPLLRPFGLLEWLQNRHGLAQVATLAAAAELADCDAYRGSDTTRRGRHTRSETKHVRSFLAAEVRAARRLEVEAEDAISREISRLRERGRLLTN